MSWVDLEEDLCADIEEAIVLLFSPRLRSEMQEGDRRRIGLAPTAVPGAAELARVAARERAR